MTRFMLTVHVLAATVWAGGHLVLSLSVLPKALRAGNPQIVHDFESAYERVGLPALLIQVITGIWLAWRLIPDVGAWFTFGSPIATTIGVKLILLAVTLALAVHARLRLVPRLEEGALKPLAFHIVAITIVAVLMVVAGVGFRTGGVF